MNKQKIFIIVIAVVVIGLGVYLYATGQIGVGSRTSSSTLASTTTGQNPVAINNNSTISEQQGVEIANLLNNISRIQLNNTLFSDPAFLSLTDSSIILPFVDVSGRVNPFARNGAVTTTTSATNTTTRN